MYTIKGRRLLLTGATGTLGRATAMALAAAGAELILPVRSPARGEALRQELLAQTPAARLSFPPLNLADEASVHALAAALAAQAQPLDGLILNAGVFTGSHLVAPTGNEWHRQVNHLSPLLLTTLLLPLLKTSDQPCVTTVTSLSAFWPPTLLPPDGPTGLYAASKRGLLCGLTALAREEPAIRFVYAHPGVCATGLFQGEGNHTAYSKAFLRLALPLMKLLLPTPEKACRTTLYALEQLDGGMLAQPRGPLHIWGKPAATSLARKLKAEP